MRTVLPYFIEPTSPDNSLSLPKPLRHRFWAFSEEGLQRCLPIPEQWKLSIVELAKLGPLSWPRES